MDDFTQKNKEVVQGHQAPGQAKKPEAKDAQPAKQEIKAATIVNANKFHKV